MRTTRFKPPSHTHLFSANSTKHTHVYTPMSVKLISREGGLRMLDESRRRIEVSTQKEINEYITNMAQKQRVALLAGQAEWRYPRSSDASILFVNGLACSLRKEGIKIDRYEVQSIGRETVIWYIFRYMTDEEMNEPAAGPNGNQ